MPCFRLLGTITLLFSFSLSPAWAQRGTLHGPPISDEHKEQDQAMQRNMQRQRQKKRYEDMKRDSQKLLELATELKRYVDKSGEDMLSLDVLRKAEELEKLARQVKNNMRGE